MRAGEAVTGRQPKASAKCLREKEGVDLFKPVRVVAVASPVLGIAK